MEYKENFVENQVTDAMLKCYYEKQRKLAEQNIIYYEQALDNLLLYYPQPTKNLPLKAYAFTGALIGAGAVLVYQASPFNVSTPAYAPLVGAGICAFQCLLGGVIYGVLKNFGYHISKSIVDNKIKTNKDALISTKQKYNYILKQENELFKQ